AWGGGGGGLSGVGGRGGGMLGAVWAYGLGSSAGSRANAEGQSASSTPARTVRSAGASGRPLWARLLIDVPDPGQYPRRAARGTRARWPGQGHSFGVPGDPSFGC